MDKIRYLVNRSDSTGGLPRGVIKEQFGREADFEVVSDGVLVLEANNRGEPFIKLGPGAQISKDVGKIAKRLTSEMPAPQPKKHAMAENQPQSGAT